MNSTILALHSCHSDGLTTNRPGPDRGMVRNDTYFLEKVAQEWARELGLTKAQCTSAKLDRLPTGFAGFEKARPDTKHVDRYVYGHPHGVFRSIKEFYPHFKHLMDHGSSTGCTCPLDTRKVHKSRLNQGSNNVSRSGRSQSVQSTRISRDFPPPATTAPPPPPPPPQTGLLVSSVPTRVLDPTDEAKGLPNGRMPSPQARGRHEQIDEDGTCDVYRGLLDRLDGLKDEEVIDEHIIEHTSPAWRVGNTMLTELLDGWRKTPRYIPRVGELVLFVRKLGEEETLAWDTSPSVQTWRCISRQSGAWLDRPKWEAGIVTQTPTEAVQVTDLVGAEEKETNVIYSGFRIEPLPGPGSDSRSFSTQHRYVPLHGIRPLTYWKQCSQGMKAEEWHPTLHHALATANSFCVISKFRFKGGKHADNGSNATIFCGGVYIGSELIITGDTVRLLPNPLEQKQDAVTDAMLVTSIKLRLVRLDQANDDDWDEGNPYNICLHISGKAFTLDPTRSFGGAGNSPVTSENALPKGLADYGKWYHLTDPTNPRARLEVPFTRILGRCHEAEAVNAWFQHPAKIAPPSVAQAVSNTEMAKRPEDRVVNLSRGLPGLLEARAYSFQHESRINKQAGKAWFWAETRIEQLSLHEVNGKPVGMKDDLRMKPQMSQFRNALKVLNGRKIAFEKCDKVKNKTSEGLSHTNLHHLQETQPINDDHDEDDEMHDVNVID